MKELLKKQIKQGVLMAIVCWIGVLIMVVTDHVDGCVMLATGGIIFPLCTLALYIKLKRNY